MLSTAAERTIENSNIMVKVTAFILDGLQRHGLVYHADIAAELDRLVPVENLTGQKEDLLESAVTILGNLYCWNGTDERGLNYSPLNY